MSDETITNLRKETGYDPDNEGSVDDLIAYKDALEDIVYALRDETYNGWKNYPTWCVNLWLSNEEGLYHEGLQLTRDVADELEVRPPFTRDEALRSEVAETFKNWVTDDLAPDLGASFASDLLGYALDTVDWFEIADAWIEQVEEGA